MGNGDDAKENIKFLSASAGLRVSSGTNVFWKGVLNCWDLECKSHYY